MSKRRTTRPSQGSQPKKPSGSNPFNKEPFTNTPKKDKLREARDKFIEGALGRKSGVDPVPQMPGMMGRPQRGKGFIPFSGGPKVKIGDQVGPPEDIIRKANQPNTASPGSTSQNSSQTGRGRKGKQRVKGDYSNPADFIKPSDLLSPIIGQPQKLPGPTEPYGPEDTRQGPIDTRKPPKRKPRTMKPVPVVPPVPQPLEEEVDGGDNRSGGVYYFDKQGRFLTRGKYNVEKIARATQRRG